MPQRAEAALGVDVGGTFTDVVAVSPDGVVTTKVSSTPADQSVAVIEGATRAGIVPDRFLHGTTVATNALLEGRGARTWLVTSPGFEDVIEIGRQDRPSLYDSFADRPPPLVPRERRVGVDDVQAGAEVLQTIVGDAEAVAISLLYSFGDPTAEASIEAAIRTAGAGPLVSRSSAVAPEFREFERTATTVLNAFLAPETGRYLSRLQERAGAASLPTDIRVMRSSGGLIDIDEARRLPAAILLSGPAGGVVAGSEVGRAMGASKVITFDMGGTSTDVCWIEDGRPEVAYERSVAGYPCRMPAVAVHTVGAGGGSLGWVDEGGSLRAGPRSAGADPGPAAYGRGGDEPTVTDANVALGRIGEDLAGGLRLQPDLALTALERLGASAGLDAVAAAAGMVTVVEEVMAGAIRRVSVEQGRDPREAMLVAFGGAGGLHAASLARAMGLSKAVIPPYAGVFSALGLLLSPPRVDAVRGTLVTGSNRERLAGLLDAVRAEAGDKLGATSSGPVTITSFVDVRYRGQSHELTIPADPGEDWRALAGRFHAEHDARNGFARPEDPIEVVAVRAEATARPALRFADLPELRPSGPAHLGERTVRDAQGETTAQLWSRPGLAVGDEVTGPAVIVEAEATTFLSRGDRATVHPTGALEIEW